MITSAPGEHGGHREHGPGPRRPDRHHEQPDAVGGRERPEVAGGVRRGAPSSPRTSAGSEKARISRATRTSRARTTLHRPARSARAASFVTRRERSGMSSARRRGGPDGRPRRQRRRPGSQATARWASTRRRSMPGSSPSTAAEIASRQRSHVIGPHRTPGRSPAAGVPGCPPVARRHPDGVPTDDPLLPYVLAAREGDGVAIGELVRLTQPAVWRCARRSGRGRGRGPRPGHLPAGARRARPLPRRRAGAGVAAVDRPAGVRRPRPLRQRRRRLADRLARHAATGTCPGPRWSTTCWR